MGQKSPTTTQTNTVQLSPEQQQVMDQFLMPAITKAAGIDYKPYAGSTVAGFSPTEVNAQNLIKSTVTGGAGGLTKAGNTAQNFLLDPSLLSPDSNPWLKSTGEAMATQISDNFTQNIMPTLRTGDVASSGMYSGGNTKAGQAQGLAAAGADRNVADALNKLYFDSYNTGLQTMQQAVQMNPQQIAANFIGPTALSAVGEQERSLNQARMDAEANKYYFNQFAPLLQANDLAGLFSSIPGGSGVSTVKGATPQSGGLKGALGGAASGAAIGSAVPIIGTGIGAALGGLAGFFS